MSKFKNKLIALLVIIPISLTHTSAANSAVDPNDNAVEQNNHSTASGNEHQTQPSINNIWSTDIQASSKSNLAGSEILNKLWSGRIQMPLSTHQTESSKKLLSLVEQINSMSFDSQTSVVSSQSPDSTQQAEQKPLFSDELLQATLNTTTEPNNSDSQTPDANQTQDELSELLKKTTQTNHPMQIAELLYISRRIEEATSFYQQALDQIKPDSRAWDQDRPWLLFQLGNCLRETDPVKARETYLSLIAEYPNSLWTELARTRGRLIDWYQKNDPQSLITKAKK
jgi:tetratricopeptide (TPR) repeat protein